MRPLCSGIDLPSPSGKPLRIPERELGGPLRLRKDYTIDIASIRLVVSRCGRPGYEPWADRAARKNINIAQRAIP